MLDRKGMPHVVQPPSGNGHLDTPGSCGSAPLEPRYRRVTVA
ncbi:hypothetical protein [Actinomadura mexicana]|nr:hypothetical protein [Actinomadura mexicana]